MIAMDELVKLPIEDREQIIEELQRSIEEDLGGMKESPEFIAEILRRADYLKENPSSGSSWDEVEKRIRAKHA
jgi:putative addiction module component (TIGR02574 family)